MFAVMPVRTLRFVSALVVATLLVLASVPARGQPRPIDPAGRVYLVPIGAFPAEWVDDLVGYYRAKLGLTIQKLAPLSLDVTVLDYPRQQLIAEELISLVKHRLPDVAGDPHAFVIGLIAYDLYIRGYSWQWAFSYRQDQRFAVVSIARMDPLNWGEPDNRDQLRTRLRKMVSKNLGIMYYGLPQSTSRSSVLYGPIVGLDDLDRVAEDF
jgi:predicted Zn-dependent protease